MAMIRLSVSEKYLPAWGVPEGLREMIQNWIDSNVDCGQEGTIKYEGGSLRGTLILKNPGAKPLDRKALLFGETTKVGRADQIGRFGEGMKVGALALLRKERAVTIKTQTEIWKGAIVTAKDFGSEKVLGFDVKETGVHVDAVSVEIYPVMKDEWDQISRNFRSLQPKPKEIDVYNHEAYGSILKDKKERGRVYVKGVLVKIINGMMFGYDLHNIVTNRDRTTIDDFDLYREIVGLWNCAYRAKSIALKSFSEMISEDLAELTYKYFWRESDLTRDLIVDLAAKKAKKGKGLVFASKKEDICSIEAFGYTPVCVTDTILEIGKGFLVDAYDAKFREKHGIKTFLEFQASINDLVQETHKLEELTPTELAGLKFAVQKLQRLGYNTSPEVVTFGGDLLGLHTSIDNRSHIQISRSILGDPVKTLCVLLHEYSHKYGPDYSRAHVENMERIYEVILNDLIKDPLKDILK